MSRYHCSCGFAIDDVDEFGDHFRIVFSPDDSIGNDGLAHAELDEDHLRAAGSVPEGGLRRHVCACGFATDITEEMDDHLLIAFIPPGSVGRDGERHVTADPSAPERWRIAGTPDQ